MKAWTLTIPGVVAAFPLLAAGAMPAMADASAGEGYRVVISDLDLQSPGGIDALYGRLRVAAFAVCGYDQARGFAERHRARRCVRATLDAEVAEFRHGVIATAAAERMAGSVD